ncbi:MULTISPECIES: cupin domain-containing protein [Streptomyces]|uniref:cupin domain-containing protein n=1 Tax=Streptomyces TaxID=1883 RepID=UPI00368CC68C
MTYEYKGDEPTSPPPRLVLTGVTDAGRSTIVSDGPTAVVYGSPFVTAAALWEAEKLPPQPGGNHHPVLHEDFAPHTGLRVFISVFPPASQWADNPEMVREVLAAAGMEPEGDRPPGFHATDTIDIQTVVDGEIYCLTDEKEVLLTQGDTIIMNGIQHAWINRSDKPATVLATMIANSPALTEEKRHA